ncbi:MAG: hypothetical protein ACYDBB_24785 [Armatimonadota bacterium]
MHRRLQVVGHLVNIVKIIPLLGEEELLQRGRINCRVFVVGNGE